MCWLEALCLINNKLQMQLWKSYWSPNHLNTHWPCGIRGMMDEHSHFVLRQDVPLPICSPICILNLLLCGPQIQLHSTHSLVFVFYQTSPLSIRLHDEWCCNLSLLHLFTKWTKLSLNTSSPAEPDLIVQWWSSLFTNRVPYVQKWQHCERVTATAATVVFQVQLTIF